MEGDDGREVGRLFAIWDAISGVWKQLIDVLMLHHKFLRRSCVEKLSKPGKYTQQTANIDGLISSARGKRPARVEEAVGSVIAVALTGDDLDPVKARRGQKNFSWCS